MPSLSLLDLRRPLSELLVQVEESSECSPRDSVWKRYFCKTDGSDVGAQPQASSSAAADRSENDVIAPAVQSSGALGSSGGSGGGAGEALVAAVVASAPGSMSMAAGSDVQDLVVPLPGSSEPCLQGLRHANGAIMSSMSEPILALPPTERVFPSGVMARNDAGEQRDAAPSTPPRLPQPASPFVVGDEMPAGACPMSPTARKAALPAPTSPSSSAVAMAAAAAAAAATAASAPVVTLAAPASASAPAVGASGGVPVICSPAGSSAGSATGSLSAFGGVVGATGSGGVGGARGIAGIAAAALEAISPQDLQMLRSLSRPHPSVREVVEATLMILGYRDATWSAIYTYFDRAEGFLEKMRVFDASRSVSRLQYQKLCRTLQSPQGSFEEGYMEATCPAAVGLVRWCRAVRELLAVRYGDFVDTRGVPSNGQAVRRPAGRSPRAGGALGAGATSAPGEEMAMNMASATGSRGGDAMGSRALTDDGREEDDDWLPPSRPHLGDMEVVPDVYAMSAAELRCVRDLTIRKPNVGEVTFPGELDLVHDRRVLEELPGIVRLERGEVLLYPDPGTKPLEGEGLNRPAIITLLGCTPPDCSLKDDESKVRYRQRIANMTEVKGATFVDYDCDRGIWRFKVSHF